MKTNFPDNPWCRYADDGLVHCKIMKQAEYIKDCLDKRLKEVSLKFTLTKLKQYTAKTVIEKEIIRI